MRAANAALLLFLGALSGCDIGIGVKFVAPSAELVGLASHNGMFWTVPGNAMLDDQTLGPQENLLYLLIVCPELAASGRGTGADYQPRVNSYISFWETKEEKVSVTVSWDKRADTVRIDQQKFKREAGSDFVVVRQPSGNLVATQLPSPGSNANPKTALSFIQKQMTNDALVASVRLAERNL